MSTDQKSRLAAEMSETMRAIALESIKSRHAEYNARLAMRGLG